ncbi:tetratricopeptide repeat protein [Desulfococcaceae bacterium HSG7]|nr:tetratricopeptide repeat protein [Desulfococcaceae bacterium HSG7]
MNNPENMKDSTQQQVTSETTTIPANATEKQTSTTNTPQESEDNPPKPKNLMARVATLYNKAKVIYTRALQILIFLVIAILLGQTIQELYNPYPVFDSFRVPKSLETVGYTGEVIAHHLRDQMLAFQKNLEKDVLQFIQTQDPTNIQKAVELPSKDPEEELDIEIPGTKFSLKTFVIQAIGIIGLEPERQRIGGDVVITDKFYLTVRISGKPSKTFESSKDDPKTAIRSAAEHVLKMLDPMTVGMAYYNKQDTQSLKALIAYIRENSPSGKEQAVALILEWYASGITISSDKALKLLQKAETLDPENPIAFQLSGASLAGKKRYEEAIEKYKQALQLDPNHLQSYMEWAETLFKQKKYKDATAKYREALESFPKSKKAWIYLSWGDALKYDDNYEEAVKKYKLAMEADPYNALIYIRWGFLLKNFLRKPEEAVEKYEQALKIQPNSARLTLLLADALTTEDQFEKAFTLYEKAAGLNPKDKMFYADWGDGLARLNRLEEAIEKYQKAVDINPNSFYLYISWSRTLQGLNRPEEAVMKLKQAMQVEPLYFDTFEDYAQLVEVWKRPLEEVNEFFEKGIQLQVRENFDKSIVSYVYLYWAQTLNLLDQPQEAIAKCQQAVEMSPLEFPAHIEWAKALITLKQFDEGFVKYEQALKEFPDEASEIFKIWAKTLIDLGRTDDAIEKFEKAVQKTNDKNKQKDVYKAWGDSFVELGRFKEAADKFSQVIQLDPKNDDVYISWGNALFEIEQTSEALAKYQEAIKLNQYNAEAYLKWGEALSRLEQPEPAFGKFKKAVELNPYNAFYAYTFGKALMGIKHHEEAMIQFERTIKFDRDGTLTDKAWCDIEQCLSELAIISK